MDFLYCRHRLNVATSRARCVAIVVASPDAAAGPRPDARADAPGQRAVPVRGDGRLAGPAGGESIRSVPAATSAAGDQLAPDPRREDPGARLDLVERDVLVGAVGDLDVARPEDDARRVADVDEQSHVRAVRLAEERRPAAGDGLDDVGQPDRQRMVRRRRAPTRTGRR